MAFALLVGTFCAVSTDADATTSRKARETLKQPRVTLQQTSARSVKPTTLKLHAGRRTAAASTHESFATPISCVPYARSVTGLDITGNAYTWWASAAGLYARGHKPERGAVLSFKSSGGMRLGHVAVVSRVVSAREILVDHANWEGPGIRKGTVMRGVSVIDVSPQNDWTEVRVQIGRSDEAYGRVYPTNGFIFNRAPNALRMAATSGDFEEVAEAPLQAGAHAEHMAEAVRSLNLDAAR
ncbi:CHAP domain-containing protein [Roseomonas sp. E05]|uniref:CHAP domain-containing protein n=1 Tax=Roseomonas sp. E05 TaxID=3046310 RepID=UPI0024BA4D6C|nr:CHAP domain-containing protein [Roseomonas sp. E05]MDJ0387231.1 CHAP domain-containing protein [Roseomonas sp. E05]